MELGLRDRVCLVTGSTGSIGLLVAEGASVVTHGRSGAPGVGEALHITADFLEPGGPGRPDSAAIEATRAFRSHHPLNSFDEPSLRESF